MKRCPVQKCGVLNSDRAALIAHYRNKHAEYAVLCEMCKIPISTWNVSFIKLHYRIRHPDMAVPFIGSSVKNERTTQLKVEIDSRVVCDLCNVRIQPENMNQHLEEMHSTHRIYCPLKRCSYVAKQMNEMRTHWKCEHKGMEFPEFRDETSFTYVIDTSNHVDDRGDNPKNVN